MKIVVIGGTGLIGKRVVDLLDKSGHEAVAASPSLGVNTITGEGLSEVLAGAEVVVDVTNSPSFEDQAVLKFFETSTRNLLAAEAEAGARHHVALSVVGADRIADSGYMRAKAAQERLIRSGQTPYTIVRATQFFEFLGGIGDSGTVDGTVRLPQALLQPIAAGDVSAALADVALEPPAGGIVEVAGPKALPFADAVRRFLSATGDARPVVVDPQARYFGAALEERTLTPDGQPRLGPTGFEQWLERFVATQV